MNLINYLLRKFYQYLQSYCFSHLYISLAQQVELAERTATQVFEHHKEAFLSRDIDKILKDHSEQSILITPNGKLYKGLDEIQIAFEYVLNTIFAKQTEMNIVQQITGEEIVYIVYTANDLATGETYLPYASDTFIIKNGKIRYQTAANGKIQK